MSDANLSPRQKMINLMYLVLTAMLALNVVDRDYGELLGRLDMNQAAPAGFLLVSKIVGSLADYSEFALRLFPCLLGIAALVLFIRLAVEVLGFWQAPLAYIPMATASP